MHEGNARRARHAPGPGDQARLLDTVLESGLETDDDGLANLNAQDFPLSNYEDVIDQSSFLRDWLGGRASSGGVDPDPMDERFASVVHNLSGAIFDDPLGFDPEDLIGTDALEAVSRSA